jgi:hypothetical protein
MFEEFDVTVAIVKNESKPLIGDNTLNGGSSSSGWINSLFPNLNLLVTSLQKSRSPTQKLCVEMSFSFLVDVWRSFVSNTATPTSNRKDLTSRALCQWR